MAAYELLLLNTAVPQIQAAQAGDTYVVPRDIAFSAALTLSAGTANGVPYLNGSKVLTTGSALTFDGTNVSNTGRYIVNAAGSVAGTTDISLGALSGGAWLNTPSGKPGYLAMAGTAAFYWDATNLISYIGGSEQMRLTSTGLGIGTSSPSSFGKLAVVGSVDVNNTVAFRTNDPTANNTSFNSIIDITGTGKDSGGVVRYNNTTIEALGSTANGGTLVFRTDDSSAVLQERMRLDSSGNLGLRVTPSAWGANWPAFQVGRAVMHTNTSDGRASFGNNYYVDGTNAVYIANASATQLMQVSGEFRFFTAPSGTAGNAISFTQALTLDANRNLLLNGTSAGASAVGTLAIFNGTAPTGSVTDGIILYAEDVSSSSELKVRDEAGNVTTLSPHNFSLIPEGPSEDMAWAYYSEKAGKRINVDMLKLARMVEQLTGEKLVYEA